MEKSLESETVEAKKWRWQYHHDVTNVVTRTDVKKSPPPIETPMFSGNAYFVVSREFVETSSKAKRFKTSWNGREHTVQMSTCGLHYSVCLQYQDQILQIVNTNSQT